MKRFQKKNKEKSLDNFIDYHNRKLIRTYGMIDKRHSDIKDEVFSGKELNITIESIGSKGDGIAKYKSYIVIVPNTKVNDKVNVIVKVVRGNLIFTELKLEILY